ncbi:hypothetical protein LEJE111609_05040 [Lelliottia jeotgali]
MQFYMLASTLISKVVVIAPERLLQQFAPVASAWKMLMQKIFGAHLRMQALPKFMGRQLKAI